MTRIAFTLAAAFLLGPIMFRPALADVTLELIGSGEFTVGQAYPHSPTELYPVVGESCLVWGRLTNVGTDVFEGIMLGAFGGEQGTCLLSMLMGGEQQNPSDDPEDPIVPTPSGLRGIQLNPGEAFAVPIWEIWGLEVGGDPPFAPAPLGAMMECQYLTINLLAGFDHEDPLGAGPDTFLVLDRGFTVTVTPEPAMSCLLAVGAVVTYGRKRR